LLIARAIENQSHVIGVNRSAPMAMVTTTATAWFTTTRHAAATLGKIVSCWATLDGDASKIPRTVSAALDADRFLLD
jgi:hypothetical protein